MWTRKAAFSITGGVISLVLIGMMISNFQLMVIGLTFVAFTVLMDGLKDMEMSRYKEFYRQIICIKVMIYLLSYELLIVP